MEGESNGMEGGQTQCRAGCGYFGSSATDGLCSICYKEVVKKKQSPPAGSIKIPSPQKNTPLCEPRTIALQPVLTKLETEGESRGEDNLTLSASSSSNSSEAVPGTSSASSSDSKKKSNRCQMCRKKVGLTGFQCRCGGMYCCLHRYSDKHDCTFDYRQLGAEEIRKNNPVVVGEKIHKI